MALMQCLECFASNTYSCFSKAALTSMAIMKVLVSIGIVVIVAVKLEDVRIELQLPDLTTLDGLVNATSTILAGGGVTPGAGGSPLPTPVPADGSAIDINATAGPVHVNAACLLQKRGSAGQLDGKSHTMCAYVFGVCAISLVATLLMASLLWCTCHLCGWGPVLELAFALLGTAWWLAAALVLQEHTDIAVNARPAAVRLVYGSAQPPPPSLRSSLAHPPPPPLSPPPPGPPGADGGEALTQQLEQLLHQWMPRDLQQWRRAVVVLSWTMMGMFAASAVLLLVEACGCLFDCCSCLCGCCCPDRPESRWRSNLRNRRKKRMGGDEYIEMCGGVTPSASVGGAPPVVLVARADLPHSPGSSSAMSAGSSPEKGGSGARRWWR